MTKNSLIQEISSRTNNYGEPNLDLDKLPEKFANDKICTVSIVIPAYNVQSSILACLASIEQSSFNENYQSKLEVIVVDDGSTDGTWDHLKSNNFLFNYVAIRQSNHGQAQALNTGICVAQGDIIISCDADMVLGYYTIEHFAAAHQQSSNTLFTGFRQDTPSSDSRVSVPQIKKRGSYIEPLFLNDERIKFPTPGWPINMCLASDHFRALGKMHYLWMPDNDGWLLPDMVIGALFSLPRSIFFKLGGYDERFVGWGCTDSYLAAKAIALNYVWASNDLTRIGHFLPPFSALQIFERDPT